MAKSDENENQEKDLALSFRLRGVEEIDYSVRTGDEEINQDDFNPNKLAFNFNFGFHENRENEEFKILIMVSYMYGEEEESKEEYVHSKVAVTYRIKDMEVYVDEDQNEVELPEELMASLFGIAFSTARGVISTRTRGTIWESYPLPVINPTKVLRESKAGSNSEEEAAE